MSVRRAALIGFLIVLVVAQGAFALRLLSGTAYASFGDATIARGDYPTADSAYRRAIHFVPYRGDWVYTRASVMRHLSGHEAAVPLYEQSLRLAPDAEQTLVGAAESFIETGRLDAAKDLLERAWTLTPYDWRVHYLAGVLATIEMRPQNAVDAFRAAQRLAPTADRVIASPLANALYGVGSFADAERTAEQALRLQPGAPAALLTRGKARLALGRPQAAREDLEAAARAFRSDYVRGGDVLKLLAESEERLASAYIAEGRAQDAAAPLERIAGDSPDAAAAAAERLLLWLQRLGARAPVELWCFAIDAFIEAGRFDEAERSLARVNTVYPDGAGGAFAAPNARLQLSDGRTADAFAVLSSAPAAARSRPEHRLAEAQAHAMAGNAAAADLEFRALLTAVNASPRVKRQAAEGLAALGNQ